MLDFSCNEDQTIVYEKIILTNKEKAEIEARHKSCRNSKKCDLYRRHATRTPNITNIALRFKCLTEGITKSATMKNTIADDAYNVYKEAEGNFSTAKQYFSNANYKLGEVQAHLETAFLYKAYQPKHFQLSPEHPYKRDFSYHDQAIIEAVAAYHIVADLQLEGVLHIPVNLNSHSCLQVNSDSGLFERLSNSQGYYPLKLFSL